MDSNILPEETHELSEAEKLLKGFCSYDVMELLMEADVEVPRGERFYDPIYEEVWG